MKPGTGNIPVVLAFAGHDPSGGAGLQADIEAVASQGCHAATVVTALTVQDTRDVTEYTAVEAIQVIAQARAILEDIPVAVIKIGMLGSIENAEAVHSILMDYPEIPVVFDPVMASGQGTDLGGQELIGVLQALLLPVTTILTPNGPEARALAPEADTLDACAFALLDHGVDYVLVTGGHEHTPSIINRLYSYHGSGCTLAASIAGLLAQGLEPFTAIHEAQDYTWNTLRHGYRPGLGQHIPHRFFWSADDEH